MSLDAVAGAWRLMSFVFTDAAGGTHHPLGRSPRGSLLITPNGYLSLIFIAADRPNFAEPDLLDGSAAEKAAAAAGYVSFGGPCRVDGDEVVVTVEHSFFPNWTGSEQRRRFSLAGDILTLSTVAAIPVNGVDRWGQATLTRA